MEPFTCQSYGCPLLRHTLAGKTFVDSVVIPQDWGDQPETLGAATSFVADVEQGRAKDPTLTPLFSGAWGNALRNSMVAVNALFGIRPFGVNESGYLGDETHQAGFLIWGNALLDLLRPSPRLKIMLSGQWSLLPAIGMDVAVGAARFFQAWKGRWLTDPRARTLADQLSDTDATLTTIYHPSKWQEKYRGLPALP
jgi:hypothetical protein